MTLTEDQQQALEKINEFLAKPEGTAFLLEGGAGVGKTFLLGQILAQLSPITCVCAPTHKAINVLRKKLDGFGAVWCQGFDDYTYNGTDVITGTTAQLLGIAPVVVEDQTADKVHFGKTGRGILTKVMPRVVIIDEVSMLGKSDFMALREQLKKAGSKLIAVGDAGQLPPVKQEALPFDKFIHRAALRQIVRQAEGSAIVTLAWAIRDGKAWAQIEGNGVRRTDKLAAAFLDAVQVPGERKEEDREVFIAYTNRRVNEVQEAACMKLYRHSRSAFDKGELVLAETNLYRNRILLCANQDELIVDSFMPEMKDDESGGIPAVMHHRGDPRKGKFTALYVPPEDLKNPAHPYVVELKRRELLAQGLQNEMKKVGGAAKDDVNQRRKRAWASFFEWRDQTIISFHHPFAITSHKSQGSTYRQVFADTADLGRFSPQALYVAVTRPREELVLARVA